MALFRCGSGSAEVKGAVLTLRNVLISPSANVIRGLVDLSDNSGSVENILFSNTATLTVGDYTVYQTGSGSSWDVYLNTAVACDVYKNGSKIGTTTAGTDFAISYNILTSDLSAVVVMIPV